MRNIDKTDMYYNAYMTSIIMYVLGESKRNDVFIRNIGNDIIEFLFNDLETDDILRLKMNVYEYRNLLQFMLDKVSNLQLGEIQFANLELTK